MRKVIFYTAYIVLFLSTTTYGQFSNWQWAKAASSSNNESANDLVYDKTSKFAYMAGSTEGGLNNIFGSSFATSFGSRDGFVAKYDSTGNVIWAFTIGSTLTDEIKGIACDPYGNIYVSGNFQNNMDCDPGIGTFNLINSGGSQDCFLAKYSSSGNFLWAVKFGGIGTDETFKLFADSNFVYVCGSYISPASFYSTNSTIKSTTATQGQTNFFGAKYNSAGIVQWVVSGGSTKNDKATDVIADKNNVYFLGTYERDFSVYNANGTSPGYLQILSSDKSDVFITAFNQSGTLQWANNVCSQDVDLAGAITQDATHIYITGSYRNNSAYFDYPTPAIIKTNKGGDDIFVASLSKTSGTYQWASGQTGSGNNDEQPSDITIDKDGNLLITGFFNNYLDYTSYGGQLIPTTGNNDVFLTCLSNTGNYLWAQKAGGNNSDLPHGMSLSQNDEIYLAGEYDGDSRFGSNNLNNDGGSNIFIAKTGCGTITNNVLSSVPVICKGSSVTINGSTPSGVQGPFTYAWEQSPDSLTWAAATGINTTKNYSVASLATKQFFRRLASAAASCTNPAISPPVVVKVDELSSPANAGPDQSVCTSSAAGSAVVPQYGTGTWSVIQGNITISSQTNPSAIFSGLVTGTTVIRWTVKNGVCPSTFDDVVITRELSPPNAIAGVDQSIVENETQLSATTPSIGTGYWELIEGKANIIDPSNPLTKVTGLQEGSNIFRWTIHNRTCAGNGDDLIVNVNPLEIPNGFSPNGDGINDHFEIPSLEHFTNVKFTVYNRWGGLVYHNEQYSNTWKGTNMSNEKLADDTYYYILEVPAKKNYSGFIILKKNK